MVKGKKEITIIQGDSYQKNVKILNVDHALIDKVIMSCIKLNINKELTYDSENDKYVFYLSPEETSTYDEIITNYDFTIKFKDDNVKTVCYKSMIRVMSKSNSL